jgi:ADP-sugar diphosphatase
MNDCKKPPILFADAIPCELHSLIAQSPLLGNWMQSVQANFTVSSVTVHHADIITKKQKPHVLFIKLNAQAVDNQGRPCHGITLLRGDAVAVLVVLECQGQEHLLLVEQPRFAVGCDAFLEIPAGMMDHQDDPIQVALAELKEEVNVHVAKHELIDLTSWWQKDLGAVKKGFTTSGGLLDEFLLLYALRLPVSPEQLSSMQNQPQLYTDESEHIISRIFPLSQAARLMRDLKGIAAIYLYQQWKQQYDESLISSQSV